MFGGLIATFKRLLERNMPPGRQTALIVWFVGMSVLTGLVAWHGDADVGPAMVSAADNPNERPERRC